MATDATGTPTAKGIRKYNPDADAPSGVGFNGAMDDIDTLFDKAQYSTDTKGTNKVAVWNGSAWVYSQVSAAMVADAPGPRQFLASDGSNHPAWTAGGWHVIGDLTAAGGVTPNFNFASIPQNFKHLKVILHGRGDGAGTMGFSSLRINGSTGGYYWQRQQASATSVSAAEALADGVGVIGFCPGAAATAGLAVVTEILLPDYTNTVFNKVWSSTSGGTSAAGTGTIFTGQFSGVNNSAAALTQLTLYPISAAGNWLNGSRATLYGLG